MGRSLYPFVRRELENLDKDADSRKNAMKALKSCVKSLDSKSIPLFLASVSKTNEQGSSTGECTISLYEVLARVHGRNIVPQIDNIMSTIIRTLSASAGSFPLHQACSKVVPAIARYGIEPSMPQDEKMRIICSLCKPLSDSLMGASETLASGAALCLKALVESDNWRFASSNMVNELCLKLAGALEENPSQTNAHMGLVMALSKHNSLTVDAYARSILRSGLVVLAAGVSEGNSQKRLSAIQMINFLMKCVDYRGISSELPKVVEAMENCQTDPMPFVKGAAFETFQTAKTVAAQKGSTSDLCLSPNVGSNFAEDYIGTGSISSELPKVVEAMENCQTDPMPFVKGAAFETFQTAKTVAAQKGSTSDLCLSPNVGSNFAEDYIGTGSSSRATSWLLSPESQTIDSFRDESFADSPLSTGQSSSSFEKARRANRRLWNNEKGCVDVSLKDGLFSGYGPSSNGIEQNHVAESPDTSNEQSGNFSGFVETRYASMVARCQTPSPQREWSNLAMEDVKIFSTPRKLIRALQNPEDGIACCNGKQNGGFACSKMNTTSPLVKDMETNGNGSCYSHNMKCLAGNEVENKLVLNDENNTDCMDAASDHSESVSSSGDVIPTDTNGNVVSCEACKETVKDEVQATKVTRRISKAAISLLCGFTLIIPAVVVSIMSSTREEDLLNLVPT